MIEWLRKNYGWEAKKELWFVLGPVAFLLILAVVRDQAALWVLIIVIAFASGFVSQYVASARGHSSYLFFWVGFFLPIVGLIVAFLTPPPERELAGQPPRDIANRTLPSQLAELANLHRSGALSDSEFETAKRRLLGEG